MYASFVENYGMYTQIRDEGLADPVAKFVDNRLLFHEAKNMLQQLCEIEKTLNVLQVF